jgi:hypothetical protein
LFLDSGSPWAFPDVSQLPFPTTPIVRFAVAENETLKAAEADWLFYLNAERRSRQQELQ